MVQGLRRTCVLSWLFVMLSRPREGPVLEIYLYLGAADRTGMAGSSLDGRS